MEKWVFLLWKNYPCPYLFFYPMHLILAYTSSRITYSQPCIIINAFGCWCAWLMSHLWRGANVSTPAIGTNGLVWDAQSASYSCRAQTALKRSSAILQSKVSERKLSIQKKRRPQIIFFYFGGMGVRELPLLLDFPTFLCYVCFIPPRCSHFTHEATLLHAYVST